MLTFISPTEASTEYAPLVIATPAVWPCPSIGKNSIDPSLIGLPSRVTVPRTFARGGAPQPPARKARPRARAGRVRRTRPRLLIATDHLPAVGGRQRLPG